MTQSINQLILLLLLAGVVFRLLLTGDGNFLFTMDNARDMVDVREMVVLGKLRLTGPSSAIDGFYNGPAWYYLLAIPFILSSGDPYAAILMEIVLWVVGGFFLLRLVSRFGNLAVCLIGVVWVLSNYIVLLTLHSFNPNPVTLLTPLFVYLLEKYLTTTRLRYALATFLLGGLFFNFEMNFGVFVMPVIIVAILLTKKWQLFRQSPFWVGLLSFGMMLLPQVLFDLRHQFIMSQSVLTYISSQPKEVLQPLVGVSLLMQKFYDVFLPVLFNSRYLTQVSLALVTVGILVKLKQGLKDLKPLVVICLSLIVVPFIGYLTVPVTVNPWHLGAEGVSLIILLGWMLHELNTVGWLGKAVVAVIFILTFLAAFTNVNNFIKEFGKPSSDPSAFKNELTAVDYVYRETQGKNFKVYTYLPSVIDYPYQYLFWWRGLKRYGYIPEDYAYLPDKPAYISGKDRLGGGNIPPSSGLVFLIKEPDRGRRHLWENSFVHLNLVKKEQLGPLEVEVRR